MALDKVIDSAELDANLTAVADAIRTKGGTTEQLSFPDGFVSAVEGIQVGGGVTWDDIALTAYQDADVVLNVEQVRSFAFTASKIKTVCSDTVKRIGEQAFSECWNLTTARFPNCEILGKNADGAFGNVSGGYIFSNCYKLKTVDFSNVHTFNSSYVFRGASALEELELPALVTKLGSAHFQLCTALKKVDLGVGVASIAANDFASDTNLTTIILRSASVASLANTSAFTKTPFASGGTGGTVYVPSALISEYQQATNWSTLYAAGTCTFLPIEGSEYE